MTDFFRAWVMALSAIIIFGSMCEMILPEGRYKKYVHLAIGLMLIMSVLKPIVNNDVDIAAKIPVGEIKATKRDEVENKDAVIRIYKAKLEKSVSLEPGFENALVECDVCEEDDGFGRIDRMSIRTKEIITPEHINAVMEKYALTEDEIDIKYIGRGEEYGT